MTKATVNPRKALGLRIKELRAQKNLTQEELSERAGMFRTYMSRIESGQANPTLTMLYAIAEALEVSLVSLLALPLDTNPKRVRADVPLSRGRVKK